MESLLLVQSAFHENDDLALTAGEMYCALFFEMKWVNAT